MKFWYLANIDIQRQQFIIDTLNSCNILHYSPSIKSAQKDEETLDENISLFPGHLFMYFNPSNQKLDEIKNMPGIYSIIQYQGEPVRFSMGFINVLKLVEQNPRHLRNIDEISANSDLFNASSAEIKFIDVILSEENPNERNMLLIDLLAS